MTDDVVFQNGQSLSNVGIEAAVKLLKRLFSNFDGSLTMRLWNGINLQLGKAIAKDHSPSFILICRNPNIVRSMVLGRDPLRLADAYFHGDIDIEGDFFAAVQLKDNLHIIKLSLWERFAAIISALRLPAHIEPRNSSDSLIYDHAVKVHTKTENRDAVQFHYDVSNDFYALWLDDAMVYSCAYFEKHDDTLEQAQQAKLEHICRKLILKPDELLLDIGCGWGALVIYAAQHYGVKAHGITLSQKQFELATTRIKKAGLENQVTVSLCDYRDIKGAAIYDKIVSVGMFEHVGLKNLSLYFSTVHRLLKPCGLFLNHGITHDVEGWEKTLSTEFINRYIFPDGQLDTVSNIQRAMEQTKFEISDVESLRPHYALTLRHWVSRLENHHEDALQYVTESTFRVWRLYMAACALEFEAGKIGIYQILANKREIGQSRLPLTRKHIYSQ
ncbi:MAG: cyclopropane-fatty-acyl-phospholipid synthase family protein [Pseudomonadota bacterium]